MTMCHPRRLQVLTRPATLLLLLACLGTSARANDRPSVSMWGGADFWRQPQGLAQNTVVSILQTRDGYLWVGTKGGLSRFDGVRFTTFDDRDKTQLRENEVWALAEGADGSVWIGTYGGGLSRFKDGRFTVYTTADGLVNDYVANLHTAGGRQSLDRHRWRREQISRWPIHELHRQRRALA